MWGGGGVLLSLEGMGGMFRFFCFREQGRGGVCFVLFSRAGGCFVLSFSGARGEGGVKAWQYISRCKY